MWRKEFSQTIITQYKDRYENDKAECNKCIKNVSCFVNFKVFIQCE